MDDCATERPAGHGRFLVVLGVVWLVFVAMRLTPCFDMNADTGRYLALARSLADGSGYTLGGRFHHAYPPGYPLLLSAVARPESGDWRAEKLFGAVATLGAVLCSYWLLAQRFEGARLRLLAFIVAVSPPLVDYSARIRPDVLFFFMTAAFLAASDRYWRDAEVRPTWALAAAVALGASALLRTAAVALYLGAVVWALRPSLWRRDRRRCTVYLVLLAAVALPPLIGWFAWSRLHGGPPGATYGGYALGRLTSPGGIALTALGHVRDSARVYHVGGSSWATVSAVVLVPVMLLGLARRLREPRPSDFAFCAYALMVVIWPGARGPRLWLPMLPLLVGYLADGAGGLGALRGGLGRARPHLVGVVCAMILTNGVLSGAWRVIDDWRACDRGARVEGRQERVDRSAAFFAKRSPK